MFDCRLAFFPLLVAAACAQNLHREGPFWVRTLQGSEPISARSKLEITALGSISFRGGDFADIGYTCTTRVRARDAAEAERLLRRGGLRKTRRGEVSVFAFSESPGKTELAITAPRNLSQVTLATRGGNVDAFDLEGSLSAEAGGGGIKIDRIGGAVNIKTAGGTTWLGSVGGMVQCVSGGGNISAEAIGGGALIESGGGNIVIKQVKGPIRAFTAGGAIHVVRADDAVTVNTGGGRIQVDRASGMVIAKNAGGPIQVGYASSVRCESASGTIRVNNVSGSMHASTAVGNVLAEYLRGGPALDSFLSTGSGDITVLIPSNLSVTVRAENDASGNAKTILSEFRGVAVRAEGATVIAEGRINGGGPLLRISGNGGMIFIKKAPH